MEEGEALPVCPELLGGLPVPREPAEIREKGDGKRVITNSGTDVTESFLRGADAAAALAAQKNITAAVLKNGSPSCGFGQIYDGTFTGRLIRGQGLAADRLAEQSLFLFNDSQFLNSRGASLAKAGKRDLEELVRISKESFFQDSRQYSPHGGGGPEGYDSIQWHREASSRGRLYKVMFEDRMAGGVFCTIKDSRRGWINRVFIRPDLQGRGLGRRVFHLLEGMYPEIREWGLDTPVWAEHNQELYRSMGYRPHRESYCLEAGFNLVIMKKIIDRGHRSGTG